MRLPARIAAVVRGWLRPGALDSEVAAELRFHLEQQVQSNIDAGMTPEAARAPRTSRSGASTPSAMNHERPALAPRSVSSAATSPSASGCSAARRASR
jgi:hypothetical protein